MHDELKWVCLMVNGAFRHGDRKAAEKEILSIFGNDFEESRVVCNDEMVASTGEYYMFVRCRNYGSHSDRLKGSVAVVSAVPSYEEPHWFTEKELEEFAGSTAKKDSPKELKRGDLVLVKEGYLKGLFGLVSGKDGGRRYRVCFRLYVRKFAEVLPGRVLEFVDNVLDRARKLAPASKGGRCLVTHNKLCGKKSGNAGGGQGEE